MARCGTVFQSIRQAPIGSLGCDGVGEGRRHPSGVFYGRNAFLKGRIVLSSDVLCEGRLWSLLTPGTSDASCMGRCLGVPPDYDNGPGSWGVVITDLLTFLGKWDSLILLPRILLWDAF